MRKINTPLIDDDIQFVESDLDLAKGAIARASGMLRLAICIFSLHWLAGAMAWAATPAFSDSNWTSVGSGVNGDVLALAVSSNALYVGGSFTTAGGSNVSHIAKWNGTNWAPLGAGTANAVQALAVSGSDVYAGGAFRTAGGTNAN